MERQLISSQDYRFSAPQSWETTKQTTDLKFSFWRRYLSKTSSYTTTRFIVEMVLLAWVLKLVIILPISLIVVYVYSDSVIWQNPQQAVFAARPVANAILALAISPIFETVVGQWFPLTIVRQWMPCPQTALTIATLFFAVLHFISWNIMIVMAMMPVGFIFAWSFFVWQQRSTAYAIGVTVAIHALHNAIALFFMIS